MLFNLPDLVAEPHAGHTEPEHPVCLPPSLPLSGAAVICGHMPRRLRGGGCPGEAKFGVCTKLHLLTADSTPLDNMASFPDNVLIRPEPVQFFRVTAPISEL